MRKKFVRTFLLAGLIPLLVMAAVSIYLVNLTHRIDVTNLERTLARQVSTEVKKVVDEATAILELTVAFPDFAPIAFSQQDFLLESILKNNLSFHEVSFICLTERQCAVGKETKRWVRNGDELLPSLELRLRNDDPAFGFAKTGTNYFGPVEFNNGERISIAAPVKNKKGEIIAVLAGKLGLDSIQDIVKKTRLGETGYVYIVNNGGRIIAYPDGEHLGDTALHLPTVERLISQDGDAGPLGGIVYKNLDDELVSGAGELIPDLNWGVVAEWPRKETQQLITTIFFQIGGFSVLTLLVIAIIASWMAFKLIKPIAELSQGTSIIGAGNFNYRVNIKTRDELENLGTNLNKMAENLKGLEELHELRLRTELLAESLRKEQELSKLKDQFITTVSHQFNTPLTAINWALSALHDPKIKPETLEENMNIIDKSQKDIEAIVNDLITLSEVGFRYQKSKTKSADLTTLVAKALERFVELIKLKKIKIDFKKPTDAVAEVNEFTLVKAFENLIDNAISYSHDGGVIQMELVQTEKELTFKISDYGIGIPKEDQPLIFQQFFRARNAVTKKNVGTGLGLFIVKNIVEGHGGKVWFISEENKGSTFYFSIPRKS